MEAQTIVKLVYAKVEIQHGELFGIVRFRNLGLTEGSFVVPIPTAENPAPPGWKSVESVSGVKSEEVIAGWGYSEENDIAAKAFSNMNKLAGRSFYMDSVTSVNGWTVLEYTLLGRGDEDDQCTEPKVDQDPESTQPLHTCVPLFSTEDFVDPTGRERPVLIIKVDDDEVPALRVPLPSDDFRSDPVQWWPVEVITEVPAKEIARNWRRAAGGDRYFNSSLSMACDRFRAEAYACGGLPVHRDTGEIDLNQFRRNVVLRRFTAEAEKPTLFLLGRDPDILTRRTWTLLKDLRGPYLYRYRAEAGKTDGNPVIINTVGGVAKLEMIESPDTMGIVLGKSMKFGRVDKYGNKSCGEAPKFVRTSMLRFPDDSIPTIDALVHTPVFRPDGSMHDEAGYDAESQTWYAPSIKVPKVADRPTEKDVRDARNHILTMFQDFPFEPKSGGLAAAFACLLEQIVRPMIQGPRPLYAFDAPMLGQGSGKCCSFTSLTLSSSGLVPIGDLCQAPYDQQVHFPEGEAPTVPTHDGTPAKATHFYNGGKKRCLRLTTRRGYVNESTPDHKFEVATATGKDWARLGDIKPGDFVALRVAPHPGAETDLIDTECAWFLGALVADGSVNADANGPLVYTKYAEETRNQVASGIREHLNSDSYPMMRAGKVIGLFIDASARDAMTKLDLPQHTARYKYIPKTVMRSSAKVWVAFLCGLVNGDSTFEKVNFEWSTASTRLGQEVQTMLAALGVWCARKEKWVKLAGWDKPKQYWRITFSGADLLRFAEFIEFIDPVKKAKFEALVERTRAARRNTNIDIVPRVCAPLFRAVFKSGGRHSAPEHDAWKRQNAGQNAPARTRVQALIDSRPPSAEAAVLATLCADHVRWDEVVSVEDIGEQEVRDLTVPGNASFVADGFSVHNSLLATTIATAITGSRATLSEWPRESTELPKVILAQLLTGKNFVVFDNAEGVVNHSSLASLATGTSWSARLLHTNETPELPNTATWCLTLNNAQFGRDMARRVVMVRLNTGVLNPNERQHFAIADLRSWALTHRAEILYSIMTLARSWVVAGMPAPPSDLKLASYESWIHVVGGILHHNRVYGLKDALALSKTRDTSTAEHYRFVEAWAETYGSNRATPLQLAQMAEDHAIYPHLVRRGQANNWRGRNMAKEVKELAGFSFKGWTVHGHKNKSGEYQYYFLTPPERDFEVIPGGAATAQPEYGVTPLKVANAPEFEVKSEPSAPGMQGTEEHDANS